MYGFTHLCFIVGGLIKGGLHRRATRGGRGRPSLPFFEYQKKSALILEKKALIVPVLMLNLQFKM